MKIKLEREPDNNPDKPVEGANLLDVLDDWKDQLLSDLDQISGHQKPRIERWRTVGEWLNGEPKHYEQTPAEEIEKRIRFIMDLKHNFFPRNDRFCIEERKTESFMNCVEEACRKNISSNEKAQLVVNWIQLARTKCEGCLRTDDKCSYRKEGVPVPTIPE